jgi:hypothetical protein
MKSINFFQHNKRLAAIALVSVCGLLSAGCANKPKPNAAARFAEITAAVAPIKEAISACVAKASCAQGKKFGQVTGEGSTLAIELGSSITPLPVPQRSTDVVDAFATRAVSAGDDLTITLIPQTSAETGLSARDYLTVIAHIVADGRVVFFERGGCMAHAGGPVC